MRHPISPGSPLFILAVGLLAASVCDAQDKRAVQVKSPASSGSYPQQYSIDVGDVPGHAARIYEIERTFPPGTASSERSALVREKTVGFSDYTEGTGTNSSYGTWFLADGNKIYVRTSGTAQPVIQADGTKSRQATGTGVITGAAKFKDIRGTFRFQVGFDPAAGKIDTNTSGEYWLEP
jgi:hypothetical protein